MINNNIDFIRMFEQKLAQFCGTRYAVCTDCCTNAILISLHLKIILGELKKTEKLIIPAKTYMSVPMTLKLFGFNVVMNETYDWEESYDILDSKFNSIGIVDSAVSFYEGMSNYIDKKLICLSFQQKKRLNLGRGGAILLNDKDKYELLKRLVHDGRNSHIYHGDENPDDICIGFHAYLDPERAAKGLMILNQKQTLPPYQIVTSDDYPSLKRIGALCGN